MNVLVDVLPNGFKVLKITDFGLSKKETETEVQSSTLAELTTSYYISPEVIKGEKVTSKVDIWALGILFYQLATTKHPFERATNFDMKQAIKESEPASLPETVPDLIRYLVYILLHKNADSRPNAATILRLPEVNEHVQRFVKEL